MSQQQVPPQWRQGPQSRRSWWWLVPVVAVVVVGGVVAALVLTRSGGGAAADPTPGGETVAAAPTTHGPTPGTLLLVASGQGADLTGDPTPATTPANWDVAYTWDCSTLPVGAPHGSLQVSLETIDGGEPGMAIPVDVPMTAATGSGVSHQHGAGRQQFHVISGCDWTLRITAA